VELTVVAVDAPVLLGAELVEVELTRVVFVFWLGNVKFEKTRAVAWLIVRLLSNERPTTSIRITESLC
jgi:hypothetical protein